MQLSITGNDISGAALGDNAKNSYAIHLVNNGAARKVTLKGLPLAIKYLHEWITDKERGMQEQPEIKVINGEAEFTLDATCYTMLVSEN